MLIEYLCPTLNRPVELERLQESADAAIRVSQEAGPRALPTIYQELLQGSTADIAVIVADHLVIESGCADAIVAEMGQRFPDGDGVIGLTITNLDPLPGVREYSFMALSRKFRERFPSGQCYCPDYWHFYADTELGMYANEVARFYLSPAARVTTHHPNAKNAKRDDTYAASRMFKRDDDGVWSTRRARDLLWGKTFERVN